MVKRGICALCDQEKKFMRAHVITKALFKSIFREYGNVHYVSPSDLDTKNKVQDSFFDTSILCAECDNTFSPFETYFADLVKGSFEKIRAGIERKEFFPPNYSVDVYKSIDSDRLRMFFLVLIWRSSISRQPAFKEVKLGTMESWLKQQLKSGIPDSFETLPVLLFSMEDVDDIRKESVFTPIRSLFGGSSVVLFLIRGWVICYNIDGENTPFFKYRQKKGGKLNVVRLSDAQGVILLDKMTNLVGPFRKSLLKQAQQSK